ncbi:DUF6415 family natural product biosynthesis protein [Streptomyces sp. NPDC101490]|uniref:DUF6415 family natural product biosynthesis protein n=1 Tax=Streptomyces sp. NPDC101490 TaxID=3366143 RepID=UPI0038260E34
MTYGSVVHDPTGSWDSDIPLDRDANGALAAAVLRWGQGTDAPAQADIEQTALLLSGYLTILIAELATALATLPKGHPMSVTEQAGAAITIQEAQRRLDAPSHPFRRAPLAQARIRARLVETLHTALDRALADPVPAP